MIPLSHHVTVIVPTYNYGRYIFDALQSVFDQTHKVSEIIVVDDGSTDETEAIVKTLGEAVRYIKQENAGVCAARNRGVAESKGEFIAFLDADDIWKSTKIERQLAKFAEDPEIGLVHCGMREFDSDTGQTIQLHLEGDEGWIAKEIALCERSAVVGPGGTIMVRRTIIEEVGGFDTRLKNGEDWEFCLRVATKYKIGFVPEVLMDYRNHGVNASKNVTEMERSALLAWALVFRNADDEIIKLRRRSYSNLHKILAGSYLHNGQLTGFARNIVKSVWYRPSLLGYYLASALHRKMGRI